MVTLTGKMKRSPDERQKKRVYGKIIDNLTLTEVFVD